jgi:dihydrofolate reductase
MTVTLVAAIAANGVIGVDGDLPWTLPADLAHFKQLTMGHPMIMGRATFDSIGRALPGRTTIVVTRNPEWSAAPADDTVVEAALSLDAALDRALDLDDDIFIVGGGQIYRQALAAGVVDLLCITRVAAAPDGDTCFPAVDWERWRPAVTIPHPAENNRPGFEIVTYQPS